MKNLFLSLLLFCAIGASAQDSTQEVFSRYRNIRWLDVGTSLPAGYANDSITCILMSGRYYINPGYRSGVIDAMAAGLVPDGTDKSALLLRLASNPRIRMINIGSQSQGVILINQNINIGTNLVLNFVDNTKLGGTGILTGGVIHGAPYNQLFVETLEVRPEKSLLTNGEFSFQWWIPTDTTYFIRDKIHQIIRQWAGPRGLDTLGWMARETKFFFPERVYLTNRPMPPTSSSNYNGMIIPVTYPNLHFRAESSKTIMKLHHDYVRAFTRFFYVGGEERPVHNVRIEGFHFNMNNRWATYASTVAGLTAIEGTGVDANCAAIFTYTNAHTVSNVKIKNISTELIPGDAVIISNNSNDIDFDGHTFSDYARQGVTVGGHNIFYVRIKNQKKIDNKLTVSEGGDDIHFEPEGAGVGNIVVENCDVWKVTAGISTDVTFRNIRLRGTGMFGLSQFNLSKGVLLDNVNGDTTHKVSFIPSGDNVIIQNSKFKKIDIKSTADPRSRRWAKNIKIINTTVHNNTPDEYPIEIANQANVEILNNVVYSAGTEAVRLANSDSAIVRGNHITTDGASKYPLYAINTLPASQGMPVYISDNILKSVNYRGIFLSAISGQLGTNTFINTPTEIQRNAALPYKEVPLNVGNKNVTRAVTMPNYGAYKIGDEVHITGTAGSATKFIARTVGGLYEDDWTSGGSYIVNKWVRDASNNRIYRSIRAGGQAVQPSLDASNTYWQQMATAVAAFDRADGADTLLFYKTTSVSADTVNLEIKSTSKQQVVIEKGPGGDSHWATYPGSGNIENINTGLTRFNGITVNKPRIGAGIVRQVYDNFSTQRLFLQESIDSTLAIFQYRTGNAMRIRWMGYDAGGVLGANMTFNSIGLNVGTVAAARAVLDVRGFGIMEPTTLPGSAIVGHFGIDNADGLWKFRQNGVWATLGGGGGSGTVTSVAAGNGMNFTSFTTSGSVTLGTPSNVTLGSTNSVTTNSHTHAFVPGGTVNQLILGDGTLATGLSASQLYGRGASGNLAPITLGTNLSMSGTTLNAAGGGGGSGTVNSGTLNRLAYYAANGTAVSELAAITGNRMLVSNANGLPTHSTYTTTQLTNVMTPQEIGLSIKGTSNADSIRFVAGGDSMFIPTFKTGSYTPTIANTSNISSTTVSGFRWIRMGNFVDVTGYINITATSAGADVGFTISLPIASDLAGAPDATGHFTGGYNGGTSTFYGMVRGEGTLNVVAINYVHGSQASDAGTVSFRYEIK